MKIGGVVAEFNPFHNAHAAVCAAARQTGVTHMVAVMSGNFVQRGDFAVTDKRVRAACALAGGIDLVLEIPLPWAMATAQTFARGGIGLLAGCGCVDLLTFGSESADLPSLQALAQGIDSPALEARLREILPTGQTYAKARELAAREVLGDALAGRLSSPNDLLGIEYLRAANALGWNPEILLVKRKGVAHDAGKPSGGYASASYLRDQTLDFDTLARFIPPQSLTLLKQAADDGLYPADKSKLETATLAHLRRLSRADLANLPDISEGLENRLYAAIRNAGSTAGLAGAIKTKRYTLARVRRLILSGFLGLRRENSAGLPPYARILGLNTRGEEILEKMKKTATLPVDASLARLARVNDRCKTIAGLEELAGDLYALTLPMPRACGFEKKAKLAVSR
ncbi:MAG: nucleotidyltransferase family protein [Oscillospiraceae bacterium]|nr:nucleotidyltransferase family protein [Oscillospiraceae bacterium]